MIQLYRIWIFAGRHARVVSIVAGLLVMAAGIGLNSFLVMTAAVGEAASIQSNVSAQVSAVAQDARSLLVRLNESGSTACTKENLVKLRGLMHQYRYVRDIGIFNKKGRLYCTTDEGRLVRTYSMPTGGTLIYSDKLWPRSVSKRWGDPQFWPSVQLLDAPSSMRFFLLKYGRFDAVLDAYFREDMLAELTGTVWVKGPNGHLEQLLAEPVADASQERERPPKPLLEGETYHFFPLRVTIANSVKGSTMWIVQTLGTADVLRYNPGWMWGGALLSIVLGLLVMAALRPQLKRFQALAYRVRAYCNASHVRCLYQPIMRLADGKVVGAEVLMRLQIGAETLSPEAIFPHIVAQNLTWQMDKAVTAKAMEEMARLHHELGGLKLSLNLFPEDVKFSVAGAHLNALCERHGWKTEDIILELTEHNLVRSVADEIQLFREAGYEISVDDFGTGYSNLGLLKQVMPDHLKIDRSFVFDMERDSMKSSLIPEIVAIARAVHAEVTAEGIESREQLELLQKLGVEYGQGYFLGRPMGIEQFAALALARFEAEVVAQQG